MGERGNKWTVESGLNRNDFIVETNQRLNGPTTNDGRYPNHLLTPSSKTRLALSSDGEAAQPYSALGFEGTTCLRNIVVFAMCFHLAK